MSELIISDIKEFHEMLRTQWKILPIYRGETQDDYDLMPKFGRHQVLDSRNNIGREKDNLEEFKRMALSHLSYIPENDWDWLSVAQHYGLSTRLLDWTENSLIAAFFASNKKWSSDSVIYVLDRRKFLHYDKNKSPFDIDEVLLFRPNHLTPRITAQSGIFTVHNNPMEIYNSEVLQRWVLKSKCLEELYTMLSTYGTDEATVFPDLQGIAGYTNRFGLYPFPKFK